MIYGRASVMSEILVLSSSVGSAKRFLASGIGVLLGTATRMIVGS